MKIFVIGHGCLPSSAPLRGIFSFDQAQALHKAGHNVIYISLDLRSIRRWRKWGKTHFFKEGIEVYEQSIPLGRMPAKFFVTIGQLGLLSLYKEIARKHGEPDVIHAHFTDIAAISTILKKIYNLPLIITEHSSGLIYDTISNDTLFLMKKAYFNSDAIISVSSPLKRRIKHHLGSSSIVIPNIVDVNRFNYSPIKHGRFTFISVGNLIHRKGFDLLIYAFEAFKNCNVDLYIIGDGKERYNLSLLIKRLELENQIFLLGYKSRSEVAELMNKSDVFILASRGETFGVVYIEAMLAGLPVIATDCGGPSDFISEENGILVPVNDIKSLKQAMNQMFTGRNNYDSAVIRKMCIENFAPHVIASQLESVYMSVKK